LTVEASFFQEPDKSQDGISTCQADVSLFDLPVFSNRKTGDGEVRAITNLAGRLLGVEARRDAVSAGSLEQIEANDDSGANLNSRSAHLAVTLSEMGVTGREQSSRHRHRQLQRASGREHLDVYVSSIWTPRQCAQALERNGIIRRDRP
jgi:hypothetical protein